MELSQEVAKQAGEKISKAKQELQENKDSFILFLKESLNDRKDHVNFFKKIICFQFIANLILVIAIVCLSIYFIHSTNKQSKESNQQFVELNQQFMDFVNETDFYYEVELLNEYSDLNTNNLNVTK